jgi:hypothetical protein
MFIVFKYHSDTWLILHPISGGRDGCHLHRARQQAGGSGQLGLLHVQQRRRRQDGQIRRVADRKPLPTG